VPIVVVVVIAVVSPSRLPLTAATHVADVVPAILQVSDTDTVAPDTAVLEATAKLVGPSVTDTCDHR
jgi:hypothetical protein